MNWNLTAHRGAEDFEAEFIAQHLEEMGFLLSHRLTLLNGAAPRWTDVAPFDARLLAHLRALTPYGRHTHAQALARLQVEVSSEIPDEDLLAGAAYTLGAVRAEPALARQVIALAVAGAKTCLPAWERGLRLAQGDAIDLAMHDALCDAPAAATRAFLTILGWHRRLRPDVVLRVFAAWPLEVQEAAALALAKVGHTPALLPLRGALSCHPRSGAFATALLALGDDSVLSHVRALACEPAPPPGSLRLLALRGNVDDAEVLARAPRSIEAITAMGILGSSTLVPELLKLLSAPAGDPLLGTAAAAALERMSHAELRETTELTDDADDDFTPGSPSSRYVERISQDPERWTAFFSLHAARFGPGKRYRRGAEFRLTSCLDEIGDPASLFAVRHDAAQEWRLRTGRATDFEPDDVIQSQHKSLDSMRRVP